MPCRKLLPHGCQAACGFASVANRRILFGRRIRAPTDLNWGVPPAWSRSRGRVTVLGGRMPTASVGS